VDVRALGHDGPLPLELCLPMSAPHWASQMRL
jgi:hypothetical protein